MMTAEARRRDVRNFRVEVADGVATSSSTSRARA